MVINILKKTPKKKKEKTIIKRYLPGFFLHFRICHILGPMECVTFRTQVILVNFALQVWHFYVNICENFNWLSNIYSTPIDILKENNNKAYYVCVIYKIVYLLQDGYSPVIFNSTWYVDRKDILIRFVKKMTRIFKISLIWFYIETQTYVKRTWKSLL